jgi:polyphosphate glucokinase
MKSDPSQLKILSIDIGGSHVKATILDDAGALQMAYDKVVTPSPATPENMIATIKTLVKDFPPYDNVSVGFPGYIKNGVVKTAANLGTDFWADFDLSKKLEQALNKPVKVVNDADMQGLGLVNGNGLELVLTLGTGFGTALLLDGRLLPHLELAHQPITKSNTYDTYIGQKALEAIGKKKWNIRVENVLSILKTVFNYDYLYIGGGNSRKITFKLDDNVKIVSNEDGIKGGARLWAPEEKPATEITAIKKIISPQTL